MPATGAGDRFSGYPPTHPFKEVAALGGCSKEFAHCCCAGTCSGDFLAPWSSIRRLRRPFRKQLQHALRVLAAIAPSRILPRRHAPSIEFSVTVGGLSGIVDNHHHQLSCISRNFNVCKGYPLEIHWTCIASRLFCNGLPLRNPSDFIDLCLFFKGTHTVGIHWISIFYAYFARGIP